MRVTDRKQRSVFVVFLALTIVWMAVIFGFSSTNAEDSTVQSNGVVELLARIFVSGFDELSSEERQTIVDRYDGTVRKLAHFACFGILGALSGTAAMTQPFADVERYYILPVISSAVSIAFALTDEYHQMFVEGRAAQLGDVLIDSAGVLLGTAAAVFILSIISKRMNKINVKEA